MKDVKLVHQIIIIYLKSAGVPRKLRKWKSKVFKHFVFQDTVRVTFFCEKSWK